MKKPKENVTATLKRLLGQPVRLPEKFHNQTKIKRLPKAEELVSPAEWPQAWKTVFFKEYPRLDKIILPEADPLENILFKDALFQRHSERNYSKNPLTLEQISTLLYYSAGSKQFEPPWQGNRFYPSAGSRYPLEVYLISQNSELPQGIYHYNIRFHALETLLTLDKFNVDDYFNQTYVKNSSCILLISADFARNTMKYGDRGYRHVLTEVGHIGQNVWLTSAAIGTICCGVGGYLDDKLNELLDLDGVQETVVYVITLGNEDLG